MNLAVLHYHLNRGGVSRVIENQLRALDAVWPAGETLRVAVIHGGRCDGWPDGLADQLRRARLGLHVVPELDYDAVREAASPRPDRLAARIAEVLASLHFVPPETVLHVHNHALGKNVSLPGAVAVLASGGYGLLLEPHDFAEDFRPENYRALEQLAAGPDGREWHAAVYPQASRIHYATLNGRDHRLLQAAGVAADRVHLLPNPVPEIAALPARQSPRKRLAEQFGLEPQSPLLLYPVRGIRRKNVGEALLVSLLAPAGTRVGLTLAPLNPVALPIYDGWKQLAARLALPMVFELGTAAGLGFLEIVAAADAILTTSVAEGFGMVFLESWLAGRRLVGRDLPEITADFTAAGLRLDTLRPRLDVPLDWIGRARFDRRLLEAYQQTLSAYGRTMPPDADRLLDAKRTEGHVDFGDLDEPLQTDVLLRVAQSAADRRRLQAANPWLEEIFAADAVASDLVAHNAAVVRREFSLPASGRRLLAIYRRVLDANRGPVEPLTGAARILDGFLDLARFRPIRT